MTRVRHIFETCISTSREDRVRQWAYDNAYTLIFVAAMCLVLMAWLVGMSALGVE